MSWAPQLVALAVVAVSALLLLAPAAPGMVTVQPTQTDELLANPGMGWETFHCFAKDDRNLAGLPSSAAYFRWYWRELEPAKDAVNYDLVDAALRSAHEAGQKLAFRIMICGTDRNYSDSPAWLKDEGYAGFEYRYEKGPAHWAADLDDPAVLERHLKLIRALGERYDGHPDLAHVDIGSVGLWGEWHMSGTDRETPSPETCRRVIDTYLEAFRRTPLVMLIGPLRELRYATGRGTGWRADCLGDMGGFSATWSHMRDFYPQQIQKAGLQDVWKRAPVAFETCWDMRKWKEEGWDIDYIFDWALAQHASYVNNKSAPLPDGVRPQVEKLLRRLGYRFVLRSLRHFGAVQRGGGLAVEMAWENVGVAPCYADYAPAVSLVSAGGERAWTGVLDSSTRAWLPGTVSVRGELPLPAALAPGDYALEVAVVERDGTQPAVRLAIEGRAASGWYPLSRVSIR
jgi:hypothetical protein